MPKLVHLLFAVACKHVFASHLRNITSDVAGIGRGSATPMISVADSETNQHLRRRVQFSSEIENGGVGGTDRPIRGSVKIAVIMCYFDGDEEPPADRGSSYFNSLLLDGSTEGNLAHYFNSVSNGNVDFGGSQIGGWYKLSKTKDEINALKRHERIDECINAAEAEGMNVDSNAMPLVIFNNYFSANSGLGQASFLKDSEELTVAAHELLHSFHMVDSFTDDRDYCNTGWAAQGMYGDRWDIMSATNVETTQSALGLQAGPGLNAYNLDRLGWLKRSKIKRFGADGGVDQTLTLTSLSRPNDYGNLMIRIPFDPWDTKRYYTVEYRTVEGWDTGFGSDKVLIHEIDDRRVTNCGSGEVTDGPRVSYVLSDNSQPHESVNINGVRIDVVEKNSNTGKAIVRVRTTRSVRCIPGYVWREAGPGDYVCTSAERRSEVDEENRLAEQHVNPYGGPYGPDTCIYGYVWREAFPGDHVCVTPWSWFEAAWENQQAPDRRLGGKVYGPNTCQPGFVWREADDNDWVCVSPARRVQVQQENELAPALVNPNGGPWGPDTCLQGYVWREAYPGDHACVLDSRRTLARIENLNAHDRLADKEA